MKRLSSGGSLLLLAAAAVCPRGILALGLAGGALTSAGEWATGPSEFLAWFSVVFAYAGMYVCCLRARSGLRNAAGTRRMTSGVL